MTAADFAKLVRNPKRRADGKWWDARCPAHDDRRASLSFCDGDHALVTECHTGCTRERIAASVGLTVDAFSHRAKGRDERRREVIAYDYRDERGALLFQVVRFEPKDFRCRRPTGRGEWTWKLDGVRLVPYRLPELAERLRVYICEGEKDCDALSMLGLAATCNHGGAGKWRPEHTAALVAAAVPEVVVLRDNDRPGAAHQDGVARSCAAAGLRVKRLELPGLPPLREKHGEDVSDWLAAGHSLAELEASAEAAPIFELNATRAASAERPAEPSSASGPVLVRLADVTPEAIEWHWPDRIARGKLALIIGEPGEGKTRVSHDVTARTTRGSAWPDAGEAPQGAVIILSAEDGIADTVRPSVDRQGGDPEHVYILRAVRIEGQECPFNLERDLPALEQALVATKAVLLVVDPVSAYLGSKDSYKDSEIRGILSPLAALAERYRVAIIGIMHLTKAAQRRLLLRAQGTVAFVAQARTVLAVGEDPERPRRRFLLAIKNNLGPTPLGLAFHIGEHGLIWEPEPVDGTADRLLAVDEPTTRSERRELDHAIQFLRDALRDGPVPSKQVMGDAKANGISQRTLWRAKAELHVDAQRAKGQTGPWYWLPPSEPRP